MNAPERTPRQPFTTCRIVEQNLSQRSGAGIKGNFFITGGQLWRMEKLLYVVRCGLVYELSLRTGQRLISAPVNAIPAAIKYAHR